MSSFVSAEKRHQVFLDMKSCVESCNIDGAREVMNKMLGSRKKVKAPSLLLNWIGFLVVMAIFVKTSLTLTFGFFPGTDIMSLVVDFCLCALFMTERVLEGHEIGLPDLLVVVPPLLAVVWKAPAMLLLARCVASLWRFVLGLKAVGDGKWTRLVGLFCVFLLCGHIVASLWFKLGLLQEHSIAFGPTDVFASPDALAYWRVYIFAMKALTQGPDGDPTTALEIALSLLIMLLGFSGKAKRKNRFVFFFDFFFSDGFDSWFDWIDAHGSRRRKRSLVWSCLFVCLFICLFVVCFCLFVCFCLLLSLKHDQDFKI